MSKRLNYAEALRYLYSLQSRGMRLDLQGMRAATALCDHPQRHFKVVHVAGTNGKGSTATIIASILGAAGWRTGLYTSPHLHRFVERIRIDGKPLPTAALVQQLADLRRQLAVPEAPALTFFETSTLLAFNAFRAAKCQIAVIEVGLGGRLDATNVVEPEVCVITAIGMDHMQQLGSSLEAIAAEKAGIIKPGVPVISANRDPDVRAVIAQHAAARDAPLWQLGADFEARPASPPNAWDLRVQEQRWQGLRLPLRGAHQGDNLAAAVAAIVALRHGGLTVSDTAIRSGCRAARWPGRLELIAGEPTMLFDAAHNPAGCIALSEYLQALKAYPRRILIFGAMRDKDYPEMLRILRPHFDSCLLSTTQMPRAATPTELVAGGTGEACSDVETALARARVLAGSDGLIVVAGSIFVMAAARAQRLGLRSDPPVPF